MTETEKTKIILELMLEMWNLLYMHRGEVGEKSYLEIADKISALLNYLRSNHAIRY